MKFNLKRVVAFGTVFSSLTVVSALGGCSADFSSDDEEDAVEELGQAQGTAARCGAHDIVGYAEEPSRSVKEIFVPWPCPVLPPGFDDPCSEEAKRQCADFV